MGLDLSPLAFVNLAVLIELVYYKASSVSNVTAATWYCKFWLSASPSVNQVSPMPAGDLIWVIKSLSVDCSLGLKDFDRLTWSQDPTCTCLPAASMRSSRAERSWAVSRPERPSESWPSSTTAREQPPLKVRPNESSESHKVCLLRKCLV